MPYNVIIHPICFIILDFVIILCHYA